MSRCGEMFILNSTPFVPIGQVDLRCLYLVDLVCVWILVYVYVFNSWRLSWEEMGKYVVVSN